MCLSSTGVLSKIMGDGSILYLPCELIIIYDLMLFSFKMIKPWNKKSSLLHVSGHIKAVTQLLFHPNTSFLFIFEGSEVG